MDAKVSWSCLCRNAPQPLSHRPNSGYELGTVVSHSQGRNPWPSNSQTHTIAATKCQTHIETYNFIAFESQKLRI